MFNKQGIVWMPLLAAIFYFLLSAFRNSFMQILPWEFDPLWPALACIILFATGFAFNGQQKFYSAIVSLLVCIHLISFSALQQFEITTSTAAMLFSISFVVLTERKKHAFIFFSIISFVLIVSVIVVYSNKQIKNDFDSWKGILYSAISIFLMLFVLLARYFSKSDVNGIQTTSGYNLNSSSEAIFILHPQSGQVIDCNIAAVELMNAVSKNKLTGVDLNSVQSPLTSEKISMLRQELSTKGSFAYKTAITTFNGTQKDVLLQAGRMQMQGGSVMKVTMTSFVESESLKESGSQDKLFSLFEDSTYYGAILLDQDFKIEKCNEAFTQLTGYLQADIVEMDFRQLLHPSEASDELNTLQLLLSGKQPYSRRELRIITRNKTTLWVNAVSNLLNVKNKIFIVTLLENITQRKRIEQSLLDAQQRHLELINETDYALFSVDRDHTIRNINKHCNELVFSITGIQLQQGYNLRRLLPESILIDYDQWFKRALKGESFSVEQEIKLSGNENSIFELSIHPVRNDGGIVTAINVFANEITAQKQREEALIKARDEAENATLAKSSFLATMSHEIRTPLNGVIGMARLLERTTLTPQQKEYVDSVMISGDALLSVINDILDFSKIESSQMQLENVPLPLKRVIEETFNLLSAKAVEKNLELKYNLQPDVPLFIYGDITRLRQILLNLVSNAIKFTSKGSVQIFVSHLPNGHDKLKLRFEVRDSGIGIAKDKISRLFKSFSQAESDTTRNYGGTGLGLAISKNLVELMGGKIWVESEQGKGSSFFFTIETETANASDVAYQSDSASSQLANSKVLIVSDDKITADLYSNYFRRWGMQVNTEESRENVLDFVISQLPDLIVMDQTLISDLPDALTEAIKTLNEAATIPVVAINSTHTGNSSDKLYSAHIQKNTDRSKLLDILIGVFALRDKAKQVIKGDISLSMQIPLRILVAEDNIINQKLALGIFTSLGYKIEIANNGREAIQMLRKDAFDILFMDIQMPEMDGFEATKYILEKLKPQPMPVIIAMTAFALEGDKEKCLAAGMNDYISKPILVEDIITKIQLWSKNKSTMKTTKQITTIEQESEFPIINIAVLQRLQELNAKVDPTFLRDVIQMYLQQMPQLIKDMEAFISESKADQLQMTAHKLKGSSLQIGAARLSNAAKQLEIAGRNKMMADAPSLYNELKAAAVVTEEALRQYL